MHPCRKISLLTGAALLALSGAGVYFPPPLPPKATPSGGAPVAATPSRRQPAGARNAGSSRAREAGRKPDLRGPTGAAAVLAALRRMDLADALDWLDGQRTAETGFLFEAYLAVLEPVMGAGHFSAGRDLLAATPRPDVRKLLHAAWADMWARRDPAAAAAWVAGLPSGEAEPRTMGEVAGIWAARAPAAAAAFAAALSPGEARQAALAQSLAHWCVLDLGTAAEWLHSREPHPDFDRALAVLSADARLVAVAPVSAMAFAEAVGDEALRLDAIAQVARQWSAHDAFAPRHYLETTDSLNAAQRIRVLVRLAARRGDGGGS